MSKQSDIARQFVLPERQSKLNTMLREEGLRDEQVYCICRTSDVRFMIGCDNCEEWYHGDCINISEPEASRIRKFYCKTCRLKHPSLSIKYKEKSHHHKHFKEKEKYREDKKHKHEKHSMFRNSSEKRKDRCGECEACYIREDCGRCELCKDMPKFGGLGNLKQRCKKRQCQNFLHMAKKHLISSRSEKVSEFSRNDHSYNMLSLTQSPHHEPNSSSGTLTQLTISLSDFDKKLTKYPSTTLSTSTITVADTQNIIKDSLKMKDTLSASSSTKKDQTSSVLTNMTNSKYVTDEFGDREEPDINSHTPSRRTLYSDDEDWKPSSKQQWNETSFKDSRPRKRKDKMVGKKRKTQRDSDSDNEDSSYWVQESRIPRHCLGPQCVNPAKSNSKYCSDECGLRLAEARIYSVLPQRIQEWNLTPSKGEENDRKQLEKIRCQQLEARKALQMLDDKHKELDALVERGRSLSIDPLADEEGEEDCIEGAYVYCVTCGHEIPTRRAIRHMHHCYSKLESQMSFGSMFKTRIEGNNMFCDYYNVNNHTYCKRLRVMCPEHTKEPKFSNTEVCGFPLTSDLFTETSDLCRVSKKKCIKHYCWEKLRRGTIDMERVKTCLRLDELVEQERQVRLTITSRAGVLGLMLHSTYDHDYAAKLQKQQIRGDHQYHHSKGDSQGSQVKDSKYQHSDHQYLSREPTQSKDGHHSFTQDSTTSGAVVISSNKKINPKLSSQKSGVGSQNRAMQVTTYDLPGANSSKDGGGTAYHDHMYFSSHQSKSVLSSENNKEMKPNSKQLHDHLYFSNKKK